MAISTGDLKWLAGFIEGEGWFGKGGFKGVRVCAGQNQRWPLEECRRLLGGKITWQKRATNSQGGIFIWRTSGILARSVMMTLYPLMSPIRKEQIRATLAWSNLSGPAFRYRTTCKRGHPFTNRYIIRKTGLYHRVCAECKHLDYLKRSHVKKRRIRVRA